MLVLMVGFESTSDSCDYSDNLSDVQSVSIGVRYYRLRRQISNGFPLAVSSHSKKNTIIRIALFNLYLFITMG